MGLITRLRLEFDDSHVLLRARAILDHPATRLCKILEAIESGNDVVALALCEYYDVVSTTRDSTPTKNNNAVVDQKTTTTTTNTYKNGTVANGIHHVNSPHHACNGFFPNGKLLGLHTFDDDDDDEFDDEDMTMLMPTSMIGEAEARVRFRQKLCDTSVAVFNYFLGGDLHIPQEVSFKEFQKALIYWDIEEDEISDCCLAHFNAEKSKRIVPQEQAIRDKETYMRKTVRLPWSTPVGLLYGFSSFCVVTFLFLFSFMGFEFMVSPEVHASELCDQYHGAIPQCSSIAAVKFIVSLAVIWCLVEWVFCLLIYLAYSTGSLVILVMDTVVIIPYLVLLVLSFIGAPTSPPMIDFAKYLLSFHGFIFLKLCRYFPVIQRLLFTSIKFAKEVIQLLLLNYILSAVLAFIAFYTEYMFAPDSSLFKSTFDAFWYAIVTLTTLGYGDYYQTEQYFAMLTMFLIVFPAILIQTLALIVLVRIVSESLKSGLT